MGLPPRPLTELLRRGSWPPQLPPDFVEATWRAQKPIPDPPPPASPLADAFERVLSELRADPVNGDLVGEAEGLRDRITERLAGQREARRAELEEQHAEVYARCRVALDRRDALVFDLHQAESKHNYLQGRVAEFQAKLYNAEGAKPDARGYPSAQELAAWRKAVADARAALAPWIEQLATLRGELAGITQELQEAEGQLVEAQAKEQRLLAELQNRTLPGPFGLQAWPAGS
jgi:hypothetical protein